MIICEILPATCLPFCSTSEISAAKTSLNILSEKRPVYQAQSAVLTTYIKEFSYINTEDVHQYELAVPSEGLNMMRLHVSRC